MKFINVETPEKVKDMKAVIMAILILIPTIFTFLMNVEQGDWFSLTKYSLILVLAILVIIILVLVYNKLWFDPVQASKKAAKTKVVTDEEE